MLGIRESLSESLVQFFDLRFLFCVSDFLAEQIQVFAGVGEISFRIHCPVRIGVARAVCLSVQSLTSERNAHMMISGFKDSIKSKVLCHALNSSFVSSSSTHVCTERPYIT